MSDLFSVEIWAKHLDSRKEKELFVVNIPGLVIQNRTPRNIIADTDFPPHMYSD